MSCCAGIVSAVNSNSSFSYLRASVSFNSERRTMLTAGPRISLSPYVRIMSFWPMTFGNRGVAITRIRVLLNSPPPNAPPELGVAHVSEGVGGEVEATERRVGGEHGTERRRRGRRHAVGGDVELGERRARGSASQGASERVAAGVDDEVVAEYQSTQGCVARQTERQRQRAVRTDVVVSQIQLQTHTPVQRRLAHLWPLRTCAI